jgi:hypothetical protein
MVVVFIGIVENKFVSLKVCVVRDPVQLGGVAVLHALQNAVSVFDACGLPLLQLSANLRKVQHPLTVVIH